MAARQLYIDMPVLDRVAGKAIAMHLNTADVGHRICVRVRAWLCRLCDDTLVYVKWGDNRINESVQ